LLTYDEKKEALTSAFICFNLRNALLLL